MIKDFQWQPPQLNRRQFVQGAVAGLALGFYLPGARKAFADAAADAAKAANAEALQAMAGDGSGFTPNAFIHIAPDSTVTIAIKHLDMGQGAYTGLATLVAEELDADWSKVRGEGAPAITAVYKNNFFGLQGVGGSTGLANSYMQMRQAGATARAMLVAAAAAQWGVKADEIQVENSMLSHGSGKQASFGELADAAAKQPVPENVALKKPEQFRLIGKTAPKLDSSAKVTGKALYTIDMQAPGALTVLVARPPLFGATMKSFDASAAKKVKGVVAVHAIPSGVAVYAKDFWSAKKARDALKVQWDESGAEKRSSEALIKEYKQAAQNLGHKVTSKGDAEKALKGASKVITAEYVFPYLAHAPMEPLNCFIEPTRTGIKASYGCQMQTTDQMTMAKIIGLQPNQVEINTLFAGGSFGRRAQQNSDVAAEAAHAFKALGGKTPIKLLWTREDDIHGGFYRPMMVHRVRGAVLDGKIIAWEHTLVGQSILKGSPFEGMIKNGVDATSVEGAAEIPYAVENHEVSLHDTQLKVPVLWWRSVGSTHTAFAVETFLDELIAEMQGDPVKTRMQLLPTGSREAGVLKAVADLAAWNGAKVDANRARGVAVHKSFNTYVAQIAEVSKGSDGRPKVEKVWCAVDCGVAVNPDIIRAQMEGGIGFGLGAALFDAITLQQGKVQQNNFDGYLPIRISDMPAVAVVIVNSAENPTGVGEPGVPPIAPAVANAWAALTGQRVRELPFNKA